MSSANQNVSSSTRVKPEYKHSRNIKSNESQEKVVKESELKSADVKKENLTVKEKREREKKKKKEKEDGEVSSEDSSSDDGWPVCRYYLTNSCTWGKNCNFKHPGSKAMGNYEMFERMELPLSTNMQGICGTPWMEYPNKSMDSFDGNLQELKEMMKDAGYKVDQNNTRIRRKPWLEVNDLHKVPYYANQIDKNLAKNSNLPSTERYERCPPSITKPYRKVTLQLNRPPSSSSSSDYSSTTSSCSSSSCSSTNSWNIRKRKLNYHPKRNVKRQRVGAYTSSSSSDSSTSRSTSSSSKLSSCSSDLYTRSYRKKKYYNSKELDRMFLKRKLSYVERRTKYVEAKISMKERFLNRED